jgi:hypothetical protein
MQNKETAHERFMKLIAGDPQFVEAPRSGKGFVIGGHKPSGQIRAKGEEELREQH